MKMTFYVLAQANDADTDLEEDAGMEGVYAVAGQWKGKGEPNDEACVKDVLDTFHDQWGIDNLDNFDIRVVNAQGHELSEPEEAIRGCLVPEDEVGTLEAERVGENIGAFLRRLRRDVVAPKRPRTPR